MNRVKAKWNRSRGETISPELPEKCCYCMAEPAGTLSIKEKGFRLEVPYCSSHLENARKYYHEVYNSKKRKYVKYMSWIIAPVAAYIFVFLSLPASDIITGEDKIVKMFMEAFGHTYTPDQNIDYNAIPIWIKIVFMGLLWGAFHKIIPYMLDKWMVLYKGAYDLGFWENRYITFITPGIMELDREEEANGEIPYTLTFLRRTTGCLPTKRSIHKN